VTGPLPQDGIAWRSVVEAHAMYRALRVLSRPGQTVEAGVYIDVVRRMTLRDVRANVRGFAPRYTRDWDEWLATSSDDRAEPFGRILGGWHATRGSGEMRHIRARGGHEPPFIEDLLEAAAEPLRTLGDLTVMAVTHRTPDQSLALCNLWRGFSGLTTTGRASCVGITKAVLLLTNGRIGPALDSTVMKSVGVSPPSTCQDWLSVLEAVSEDISAFETIHGPLSKAVPAGFAHLEYGRLYDMILGPRAAASP
jgi:hypothetical protein